MSSNKPQMLVLGFDCATPQLVFDRFKGSLPNISKLMDEGYASELESTIPPITVPAWTAMTTGKTPGELGFYGFRNRLDYSYDEMGVCNNSSVRAERVWDCLASKGLRSLIVGIPQTFPPKIHNGVMVSGFMTPSTDLDYTSPPEFKDRLEDMFGEYKTDVANFRMVDKLLLKTEIFDMTRQRFELIAEMIKEDSFDFVMSVEIGLDRIHHAFWRDMELADNGGEKNEFSDVIKDYYVYLDVELGKLLDIISEDTAVVIVSDHGAKSLKGGICINDWLINEGYLVLNKPVQGALSMSAVDWDKTVAWGAGGYYARLFMNVAGREPGGIVAQSDYEKIRLEITQKIEGIVDAQGEPLQNRVFYPGDIYSTVEGVSPDLMVYFGDLNYRSIGSIGHDSIIVSENDEGADFANHAQNGIFICNNQCKGVNHDLAVMGICDVFDVIKCNF